MLMQDSRVKYKTGSPEKNGIRIERSLMARITLQSSGKDTEILRHLSGNS